MGIYIFAVVITYVLALLGTKYGSNDEDNLGTVKPNKIFVYLIIVTLVAISGFRYMNYYLSDEWIYRQGYLQLVDNDDFASIFSGREWGFGLLSWLLSGLSSDPQIMIFTVALITNVLIVLTLAKLGRPFELSIFLYVAFVDYFGSFNILRQYLAMSIIFWGLRYVLEGMFWRYFMLVFIAASIHSSSWLVLPIYFIVRRKTLSKWIVPLFVAALAILANFQGFANFFLTDSIYSNYISDIEQDAYGVNPIRVATYFGPLILLLINKKKLTKINAHNSTFINYSIISCLIMLISLIYVYVARIDTFFGIVSIIIIPQLTMAFTNKKYCRVFYGSILLFYFLFGLYQASISQIYYNILFEDIGGTLR